MISSKYFHPLGQASPMRHRTEVPNHCGFCPDTMEEIKCFLLACTSTKKTGAVVGTLNPKMKFSPEITSKRIQTPWSRTPCYCFLTPKHLQVPFLRQS